MILDVVTTSDNRAVDIDVYDDGVVRANVYVEIHEGRAVLVVTPAIESRDSDEAKYFIDLMTGKQITQ